mgnify:CR=1 FL=1
MNILLKNKVASAVAATLLLASAPSFAADEPVEYFPDGNMESGITDFSDGNSAFTNGPIPDPILAWNLMLHPKKGTEYRKRAYDSKSGWCRFIDNSIKTSNVGAPGASEHAPAPNETTVAYCNHMRKAETDGIGRQVNNIQMGGTYNLSADGATNGSLRWAYSYSKIGASIIDGLPELTSVSLTNIVVSDGAWQTVTDSFVAPMDVDLAHPVHVFVQTPGSEAFPTNTGNIQKTDRARLWIDNISLIGPPMPDMDEDGVNDFVDKFPTNDAAAYDYDDDGMPDDFLDSCDEACQATSGLTVDDDNDIVLDINDAYPLDETQSVMVKIGPDFSMFTGNSTVTLDASASVPNSTIGTYTWTQISGSTVELAQAGQMA